MNVGTEKRVINFEGKFAKNASDNLQTEDASVANDAESEFAQREDMIDGFLAGLNVQSVQIDQGPTRDEMLAQAQEEADLIVVNAKYEATTIKERAEKEAEILYENKKRDGHLEGLKQAEQEMEARIAKLEETYRQKEAELEVAYNHKMEGMESEIIDAVIRVFHHVFDVQLDNKKQILLHLVKNTVLDVESSKEFHVRVSPANFKFVETHMGEIKEKVGNDVQIEVLGDATLSDDACVIETESGVFDCSIDMELSNLEKDIRALCR